MRADTNVAIIDDDKLSTHNLAVKLRFIGESPLRLNADNWFEFFTEGKTSEKVFAVLIGTLKKITSQDLLNQLYMVCPDVPIILTGADAQLAGLPNEIQKQVVACYKRPVHYQQFQVAINECKVRRGLEIEELSSNIIAKNGTALFRSLVGSSDSIVRVQELLAQLAGRQTTVLISGESGAGKEVVARNLHYNSGRHEQPFIALNCAAFSHELLSAELFGVTRAYLDNDAEQEGCLERADQGTLFLDAIDEMPPASQALLLKFLEDNTFKRLGGTQSMSSNCRLIAATAANLEKMVGEGKFRRDLYYRLNGFPICVPPLRERVADIPALLEQLIIRLEKQHHSAVRFNTSALRSLQKHSWPGNVRELANLVERLSIIKPNAMIGILDLPVNYQYGETIADRSEAPKEAGQEQQPVQPAPQKVVSQTIATQLDDASLEDCLSSFAKNLIEVALEDSAGIQEIAAERLRLTPQELKEKLQRYKVDAA